MKLLTLNLQHGGGARIPQLADYCIASAADIFVFSEFRNSRSGRALVAMLDEAGYKFSARSEGSPRENGVAVFSRHPMRQIPHEGLIDADVQRLVSVRVGSIELDAVYFAQGEKKASLFEFLTNRRSRPSQTPYFLMGDFNTGKHRIDESNATFACAEAFDRLGDSGLIDIWRNRFPERREFSWFSHRGNGFRVDHAFATESGNRLVREVQYDQTPRLEGSSDHAALIVRL